MRHFNKHQKILIALTSCFLAISVLPSVIYPMVKKYDTYDIEKTENRAINEWPTQFSNDIGTKIDLFVNDHSPFRGWLVQLHNLINSINANSNGKKFFDSAFIGKEDWLFFMGESELNYYSHINLPTKKDLEKIYQKLCKLSEKMGDINKKIEIVICPNKTTMYPEYIPEEIQVIGEVGRVEMINNYLEEHNSPIKFVFLKDPLENLKKSGQKIYFKQDTHWMPNAAYIGCKEMLHNVGVEVGSANIVETTSMRGDLSALVNRDQTEEESYIVNYKENISVKWEEASYTSTTKGNEGTVSFMKSTSTNTNGKNLFIVRDSFAEYFQDILAKEYENMSFVHTHNFNSSIIESPEFKSADTVIFESVERAESILYEKALTSKEGLLDELIYGLNYYKN